MKKLAAPVLIILFLLASYGVYVLLQRYLDEEEAMRQIAVEEEVRLAEEEEDEYEPAFEPVFTETLEGVTVEEIDLFNRKVREGQSEAAIGRWEHAKGYMRQAIDMTTNNTLRAVAGQEMGEVLLQQAQAHPWPHALEAEQYLEGALAFERDPERRARGEQLLDEAREALYSHMLEELPETGSRFQMEQMLERAKPYMRSPEKQLEYQLREANAQQRTVLSSSWFEEYAAEHPGEDPEELRRELAARTVEQYLDLAERSRGKVRDEAYFRAAELLVDQEEYDWADQVIQDFLRNEPLDFIPETTILLARIAKALEDYRRAAHLLVQYITRNRLTHEVQELSLRLVDHMERTGLFKAAAEMLERLAEAPEMESRARLLKARALLYRGDHHESVRQPEQAEEIYSRLVAGDYPATIKQAAVSRLFDMQLQQKRSDIGMLLIGIQAVEADPDNRYAQTILVQMARTIEELGLPRYAQDVYDKIALLGMAAVDDGLDEAALPISLEEAALGTARCLYKAGDELSADYLLRSICNFYDPGPVRSEAAFWWAQIAFNNGQLVEATRRIGLMNLDELPPEFTAKANVLNGFISMQMGIGSEEIINQVLRELDLLPDTERAFIRHYYRTFFDIWERRGNVRAMRHWFRGALASPHRDLLPVDAFLFRTANMIKEREGLPGVLRYVDDLQDVLDPEERVWLAEQLRPELWRDMRHLGQANRNIGRLLADLQRTQRERR